MPRVPTRKRRNRLAHQKGGDPIVQEVFHPTTRNIDEILTDVFDREHVGEIVDSILADARIHAPLLEKMFMKAIEENNVPTTQTLLANSNPQLTEEFMKDSGVLVQAMTLGHIAILKLLLADPRVDPNMSDWQQDERGLAAAVRTQSPEIVQAFLEEPRVNVVLDNNAALITAIEMGYVSILERLLSSERVDATAFENQAVRQAAEQENGDILSTLLRLSPDVNPAVDRNYPIRHASENGFTEVVNVLMTDARVDPTALGNSPLLLAIQNNHEDTALVLLGNNTVDPSVDDNQAIQYAAMNGNLYLISILICNYPKVVENTNILEFAKAGTYRSEVNDHILHLFSDSSVCDIPRQEQVDISVNTVVYKADMVSFNFNEVEYIPIAVELSVRDNLLVRSNQSFFTLQRSTLEGDFATNTNIRFECNKESEGGSIHKQDVIADIPYYYMKGNGNFLVKQSQLRSAMKQCSIIELVKSDKHIPYIASYQTVQGTRGFLLDGTPMVPEAYVGEPMREPSGGFLHTTDEFNDQPMRGPSGEVILHNFPYVSADHCQSGTEQTVYEIRGVVLSQT